ncbi:orotidine 5'-phosphate decarboxylase, partial [Candidatus Roizmanbacteria bacterium CG11_big_fil_rev_8_21_14_0_20_37_16]
MTFQEKLDRIVKKNKSLVCVGLDQNLLSFNKTIIEATHDLVCSYKLNTAFYESIGYEGVNALKDTCDYLKEKYPEIPIIIDAKRG